LTFVTNKGVKSPAFGGLGGTYAIVTFPDQYRIVGIYGLKTTNSLNSLGFYLAKTIYPTKADKVFDFNGESEVLKFNLQT
jgi:hypothetical protein